MIIERETTVTFTGHRTYDGSHNDAIRDAIRRYYRRGYRTFLTGMAAGFDLSAGECVVALKEELPELRLHCIIPFEGQRRSFRSTSGGLYDRLLRSADEVTTLAPRYDSRAYHRRNDFLVDNASAVIAWFDGSAGGTEYTIHRALAEGLDIENLWHGLFAQMQF